MAWGALLYFPHSEAPLPKWSLGRTRKPFPTELRGGEKSRSFPSNRGVEKTSVLKKHPSFWKFMEVQAEVKLPRGFEHRSRSGKGPKGVVFNCNRKG